MSQSKMSPASPHDSMQLLSFNRSQINISRNSQYRISTSERGISPKSSATKSSATKSRTPFDRAEELAEENLSAGVEYKGGFGIRLEAADKKDSDAENVEFEMLKAELAERRLKQAQREQEMQEMLESKLESSKEGIITKPVVEKLPLGKGALCAQASIITIDGMQVLRCYKEEPGHVDKAKEADVNLPTTGGTVETEGPAEEASEEPAVWCCGKQRRCALM